MRRRRLLFIVAAMALLGVAGFVWLTWVSDPAPTPGVTLENFRHLRKGMPESYVEALLGKPQQATGEFSNTFKARSGSYSGSLHWRNGNFHISLQFNAGRLSGGHTALVDFGPPFDYKMVESLRPAEESLLSRIRKSLHF